MRVIIAGSRDVTEYEEVIVAMAAAMEEWGHPKISHVVSGCARGVDRLGEQWAAEHGLPVAKYPADWARLGKKAGWVRNQKMADNADALVAIWDGQSRGTAMMIGIARAKGLRVYVKSPGPLGKGQGL